MVDPFCLRFATNEAVQVARCTDHTLGEHVKHQILLPLYIEQNGDIDYRLVGINVGLEVFAYPGTQRAGCDKAGGLAVLEERRDEHVQLKVEDHCHEWVSWTK